jgi:hypothetical protein
VTTPGIPGSGGGLADALNILLDKGLVIDASVRVSLIGIEILSVEAKIVISSVDTYIRYLEAMQRLEAQRQGLANGTPPPMVTQGVTGTLGLAPAAAPAQFAGQNWPQVRPLGGPAPGDTPSPRDAK